MERTHGQTVWISMARKTRQCNHGKGMSFIHRCKTKSCNHDAKGSLWSGKCHDMCSEELAPSSVQEWM